MHNGAMPRPLTGKHSVRGFSESIRVTLPQWLARGPIGINKPNRSTVLRWFRGNTLPRSQENLLSLAAVLDLDPFSLWQ